MKINLLCTEVRGGCDDASKEIGHDAGFVGLIGTDMVTTGNGPALPDLAPSTNASSSDVRVDAWRARWRKTR